MELREAIPAVVVALSAAAVAVVISRRVAEMLIVLVEAELTLGALTVALAPANIGIVADALAIAADFTVNARVAADATAGLLARKVVAADTRAT
jgi:hypothetical protein